MSGKPFQFTNLFETRIIDKIFEMAAKDANSIPFDCRCTKGTQVTDDGSPPMFHDW